MQRYLLDLVFYSVWVKFELIQEHIALDFARHTFNCDLGELLESHDRRIVVIPILKLNTVVVVHVELEPSRPKQVNAHRLLLEAKSV